MYDMEEESDDASDRSNNIGPADNNEAVVIEKIVTNIQATCSQVRKHRNHISLVQGKFSNQCQTNRNMDVIITGVGEDTNKMIAELDEDDQYGIMNTLVIKDTEE